ncbi:MAG: Holliday junction resolvase RuvX [Hydrogenophilaceae bacterium]|nr:Holliday junction resolvase RuvX [Hydrogenophilaceae bacterium]
MPILALPDFAAALPAGPLIGLDPGSKRIGLAVSDATRLIATPLIVIARKRFADDAARVFAAYDERGCVGLVVGLPLNMDGTSGPAAQSARAFARNLLALRDVPLLLWDERLSTSEAARALIEADASRARRAEVVDKVAAAITLQSALDALRARMP